MVEFAIRMPGDRGRDVFLAVDAKFPTEDWDRLVARLRGRRCRCRTQAARRALEQRVRAKAAKIAGKYIRPPLTVEFAVLFCRPRGCMPRSRASPARSRISAAPAVCWLLGPSLLPAMLRTIQMGHVTIALGEKADMVRELLGATKAEMGKMDEVLVRLRKQVAAVGNTIDAAQVRTRAVTRKLRGVDAVDGSRAAALLEIEADEPLGERRRVMSLPQLQSAIGLLLLAGLAWALGGFRRGVPLRVVVSGLVLQLALAAAAAATCPGRARIFARIGDGVNALATATRVGTSLVFGYLGGGPLPFPEPFPGASLHPVLPGAAAGAGGRRAVRRAVPLGGAAGDREGHGARAAPRCSASAARRDSAWRRMSSSAWSRRR